MKTLLRIDASIRTKGSHSRALADFFVTHCKNTNLGGRVVYRDITKQEIPHLQNKTVETFYTPEDHYSEENKKAIALSDELIAELKAADQILISSPLYNLNVPSTLKAYFDHVIRSGVTFKVAEDGSYHGLLSNEATYVITTKGSTYKGTPMEALDYQTPYLKTIFGFIGIELKAIFPLESTAHEEILEQNKKLLELEILKTLNTQI